MTLLNSSWRIKHQYIFKERQGLFVKAKNKALHSAAYVISHGLKEVHQKLFMAVTKSSLIVTNAANVIIGSISTALKYVESKFLKGMMILFVLIVLYLPQFHGHIHST